MSMALDFVRNFDVDYELPSYEVWELIEEHPDFLETVPGTYDVVGHSRWAVDYSQVIRFKDDSYAIAMWAEGATEYQDDHPSDFSFGVVEPREVTETKYFPVVG